jgi:hypothetical protein
VNVINKIKQLIYLFRSLDARLVNIQNALGRIELRQNISRESLEIHDSEFQVFSQWGEDGIIQHIVNHIEIKNPIFIEFGVETYTESNTRFLLINNNWSGLVIDGSESNVNYIKSDKIYWRYNLKAECSFIDKDNINQIIKKNGISGEIGLLSVDIDGNDYWVWDAINVVNPAIIVCEYNSLWGANKSVTTPYKADFTRNAAHPSNLYYGASIQALVDLAKHKGYALVAGNKAGNNVFFVRNDLLKDLPTISAEQAWVKSQFRESRDINNKLTFLDYEARRELIEELPLFDTRTQSIIKVRDLP